MSGDRSEQGRPSGLTVEGELAAARLRIAELEDSIAELAAGLRFTVKAATPELELRPGAPPAASTISNLEELVLLVNVDRTVGYLNEPMARLLALPDRKAVLGEALARFDHGALGKGTLAALIAAAQRMEEPVVVERVVPGLAPERLGPTSAERPVGDPILRFTATPLEGRVQVAVQDVTRLRWLERTFARFVSPRVIEQLLGRPAAEFLDMQRREISMLYVDLRGFTRLSQTMELGTLQAMMRRYLESMQGCVERYDGTVGQFVGDEVVALFGAPLAAPDHALRALCAAVAMMRAHVETCGAWREAGWPAPGIGIGIATGEVAVGNMGTESLMYYTALGYPMNLGARLCASAEAGEILTIPATHQQAREARKGSSLRAELPRLRFESRGVCHFKNVLEPVEVVRVLADD